MNPRTVYQFSQVISLVCLFDRLTASDMLKTPNPTAAGRVTSVHWSSITPGLKGWTITRHVWCSWSRAANWMVAFFSLTLIFWYLSSRWSRNRSWKHGWWVVVMDGWQSESTDGPKGGWSCAFLGWLQWLQWSHHSQLLDVVWCSAVIVWCQVQKLRKSRRIASFSNLQIDR